MKVVAFSGSPRRESNKAPKRVLIKKKLIKLMTVVTKLFKGSDKLPTICIFGCDGLKLVTPVQEDYEEEELDCRCYYFNSNLEQVLIQDRPHVIITIGNLAFFPNLIKAPFEIRKRWLHYDTLPDLTQFGIDAYNCYLTNMFNDLGGGWQSPRYRFYPRL